MSSSFTVYNFNDVIPTYDCVMGCFNQYVNLLFAQHGIKGEIHANLTLVSSSEKTVPKGSDEFIYTEEGTNTLWVSFEGLEDCFYIVMVNFFCRNSKRHFSFQYTFGVVSYNQVRNAFFDGYKTKCIFQLHSQQLHG